MLEIVKVAAAVFEAVFEAALVAALGVVVAAAVDAPDIAVETVAVVAALAQHIEQ